MGLMGKGFEKKSKESFCYLVFEFEEEERVVVIGTQGGENRNGRGENRLET